MTQPTTALSVLFVVQAYLQTTPVHIVLGIPQGHARAKQLDCLRSSDFVKYRKFVQKWLQRKGEKQQQQQPNGDEQRRGGVGLHDVLNHNSTIQVNGSIFLLNSLALD